MMDTARIFQCGRSQTVRLPKEYRFQEKEVYVKHFGNGVFLLPMEKSWDILESALWEFEPGFHLERDKPASHEREEIAS